MKYIITRSERPGSGRLGTYRQPTVASLLIGTPLLFALDQPEFSRAVPSSTRRMTPVSALLFPRARLTIAPIAPHLQFRGNSAHARS